MPQSILDGRTAFERKLAKRTAFVSEFFVSHFCFLLEQTTRPPDGVAEISRLTSQLGKLD